MMEHDIPWQLLEMHFAKETNEFENKKVQDWIDSAVENAMIFEQLQHYYKTTGSLPVEFVADTKSALEKITKKTFHTAKPAHLSGWWWKAAAIFLLGICSWWFISQHDKTQTFGLTEILKTDTIMTEVTLADGSRVWLNNHSYIQYPKKFGSTREIYLEGEAYFEIAHDAKHPFIVRTAKTKACVLGTKFDIRSYPSEMQTKLIVTQGKVSFNNNRNQQVILTANQKGTIEVQTGKIAQSNNDNCNFMAWKTLEFQFDNQPLERVLETLADVYHFHYRFETSGLQKRLLTANFKHRPLNEIIQTISLATNVQTSFQNGIYSIR